MACFEGKGRDSTFPEYFEELKTDCDMPHLFRTKASLKPDEKDV